MPRAPRTPSSPPGERVDLPLPDAAPDEDEDEDFTTAYALVSLRWRPGLPGERDELDGWMIAGPVGAG